MSPIDLDNQVLCRGWALRCCGGALIVLGEHCPYFIRHTFDVHMIIHPPGVPIPRLQVLLGFSIAIQSPLFTVQGG